MKSTAVKLLPGLLLAALAAITYVAYRHPAGYFYLGVGLIAFTVLLFIGFTIWHYAVNATYSKLFGFFKIEDRTRAKELVDNLQPSDWVPLWYSLIVAYLIFLFYLPRLLTQIQLL